MKGLVLSVTPSSLNLIKALLLLSKYSPAILYNIRIVKLSSQTYRRTYNDVNVLVHPRALVLHVAGSIHSSQLVTQLHGLVISLQEHFKVIWKNIN